MEITGIPSMAYAIALFGYATAILVISLNRFIGWSDCRDGRESEARRKRIACVVLIFGSIDQLCVSLILFAYFPGSHFQATIFGAFGALWLLVFIFDYLPLNSRYLVPVFLGFAGYTAYTGIIFYLGGSLVTAMLMWSAMLFNLAFSSLTVFGFPKKLTCFIGIENSVVAYYLVLVLLVLASLNGFSLPT